MAPDSWIGRPCFIATLAGLVAACADPAGRPVAEPRLFSADEVRILGTSDAISHVVDLEVLPDGRVWIFNATAPLFVGFGADGTQLTAHGASGEGAREFRRPIGLVDGGLEGEAWVLDEVRRSLIQVSGPVGEWVEIPLPTDSLPPTSLMGGDDHTFARVRAARLDARIIVPRTTLSGDGSFPSMWRAMWGADLVSLDPRRGGRARTVVPLSTTLGDTEIETRFDMDIPPFPIWFRLWATCRDREIVVYDRLRKQLRRFSPTGREGPARDLPATSLETISNDEFAHAMLEVAAFEAAGSIGLEPPRVDTAALLPTIFPRIRGDGRALAEVLPHFTAIHCDDEGAVWLRRFAPREGGLRGARSWLRIPDEGAWEEVVFPERFDPFRFRGGRAWGVLRDALDVASIAWIDL